MSRNEVRAKENLNPVEGLDGYTVPLNLQDVTADEEEGTDESIDLIGTTGPDQDETPLDESLEDDETVPDEDSRQAQRDMMKATLDRIMKRWASMYERTMTSKKHKDNDAAFRAFSNDIFTAYENVEKELEPYCRAAGIDANTLSKKTIKIFDRYANEYREDPPHILALIMKSQLSDAVMHSLGE